MSRVDWLPMSDKPEVKPAAQPTHRGRAFKDMSSAQKTIWICKVVVCVVTFGMAFPGVMED